MADAALMEHYDSRVRGNAATISRRLREMADEIDRAASGTPDVVAYQVTHTLTWGWANLNLSSLVDACVDAAKLRAKREALAG